jgi:hypothetical protein
MDRKETAGDAGFVWLRIRDVKSSEILNLGENGKNWEEMGTL